MTPEEIFTALAEAEGLPRDAMIEAGTHREEMIPVFLDLIHRLRRAGPDTVAEDDLGVFLFAFFLLGEWRDTRAYRPLAALLRRDSAFLEVLLGDAMTEGTGRVMAGVFDGDLAPILDVLADDGADVFVRCQMIDALVMIARLPGSAVPADRNVWRAAACDDGAVAAPRVAGAICGHGADVFVLGDLVQQVRQDGAVAFPT